MVIFHIIISIVIVMGDSAGEHQQFTHLHFHRPTRRGPREDKREDNERIYRSTARNSDVTDVTMTSLQRNLLCGAAPKLDVCCMLSR